MLNFTLRNNILIGILVVVLIVFIFAWNFRKIEKFVPGPDRDRARNYTIKEGRYAPGFDLELLNTPDISRCVETCDRNDRCGNFAFNGKMCFLKTILRDDAYTGISDEWNTYIKRSAPTTPAPTTTPNLLNNFTKITGRYAPGGDYLSFDTTDISRCVEKCDGNPDCGNFAFNGKFCYLKKILKDDAYTGISNEWDTYVRRSAPPAITPAPTTTFAPTTTPGIYTGYDLELTVMYAHLYAFSTTNNRDEAMKKLELIFNTLKITPDMRDAIFRKSKIGDYNSMFETYGLNENNINNNIYPTKKRLLWWWMDESKRAEWLNKNR